MLYSYHIINDYDYDCEHCYDYDLKDLFTLHKYADKIVLDR